MRLFVLALLACALFLGSFSNACAAADAAGREHDIYISFPPASYELRQILDYLSICGGWSLKLNSPELGKLTVERKFLDSANERRISTRDFLSELCKALKLRLDTSHEAEKILVVWRPILISVEVRDADLRAVVLAIAEEAKVNVVLDPEVQGKVTARLVEVPWDEALASILATSGFQAVGLPSAKP